MLDTIQDDGCLKHSGPADSTDSCDRAPKIESVPEDDVVPECQVDDRSTQASEQFSGYESRKPRHPTRSRRVPNLLSGVPLIPGPMTPNFVPLGSPYSYPMSSCGYAQSVAIFPNFMLTPSVEFSEESQSSSDEFMRHAMQNAVGIPPIIVNTNFVLEDYISEPKQRGGSSQGKRDKGKRDPISRCTPKAVKPKPTAPVDSLFESRAEDFPSLGKGSPSNKGPSDRVVEVMTPSPAKSKMSPAKFPSKNQLKKKATAQ